MFKISRIILALVVVFLSGYSLFNQTPELQPFTMLSLGAFLLVIGLDELQKHRNDLHKTNKRFWGYANIIVSLFVFFVAIQGFLLN
ncbi:DUF3953 domain-containing protein [Halobacillus naozhouensis]|uniref:DUF3953 domain-containing protein n=1 Tax=Halobacillus naozhouensis TaxID=554880 RepID=A0ABY8IY98_9BACI|nr:DUF3953 domain-containing protein [Halobacillus naozhouensis]WFT74183.1 DUF3953 domain-containing protein [Halobacillus naozhouensis]